MPGLWFWQNPINTAVYEGNYQEVHIRNLTLLNGIEWRVLYSYFRDREIADWNGSKPVRLPFFMFKRIMQEEEHAGDRFGFGVFVQHRLIGSVELYHVFPHPPTPPETATLGIMIGERQLWGQHYGRQAVGAILDFAFEHLGLKRVQLSTLAHNTRAQKAFLAVGFRKTGETHYTHYTDVHMEMTREAWHDQNFSSQ